MRRAVKLRIYPTLEQVAFLDRQFGAVRFVWNKALAIKTHRYRVHGDRLSAKHDLKPLLVAAKRSRRYGWLGDFDAISLQQPGKGSTPCRCGAHERVSNARSDFQHKLSRRLVDENQAICVETLNIKGMQKNRSLAKAISDASWYSLRTKIEYKAVCTSLSVEACVNRGTPPLRPSKQKA